MSKVLLEGIRVIDFTQYLPGPYATQRLADLGAEIIKIETMNGDPARHLGEVLKEAGLVFTANNRSKKSIALNLKEDEGRKLALQLISKADVVIESFRPQVMHKLGLSYEDAKQVKEDIIYCSLTGYGQSNSISHLASHDINYLSLSGILTQLKDEEGRPVHPTIQLADLIGGIVANEAILAALVKKAREGLGSYIDLSLTEAMLSLTNNHTIIQEETGRKLGIPYIDGSIISYQIYETKDNRFISLGALEFKFWKNFCHALNKEEWLEAHLTTATRDNPIYLELVQLFKSRSLEEWSQFGMMVDCCMTPILETDELMQDSYMKDKVQLSLLKGAIAPALGENTKELLTDLLQVQEIELREWKKRGVIL